MSALRIAVLVTVHNRADITVAGLARLAALVKPMTAEFEFRTFLVDDGSTDGTSARVEELPLDVTVTRGSGSLYWNRGMALAYDTARRSSSSFDAYLLYNDDILLGDNFRDFLTKFRELGDRILVGAFVEPATDVVSYSGFIASGRLHPFSFHRPELAGELVPVDTFNGNLVAVPAKVMHSLGGLDVGYTHSLGDLDLGLRAKAVGVESYVYCEPVGTCSQGRSLDERIRSSGFRNRWKLLFQYPHGLGPYLKFARTHGIPVLLPLYLVHTVAQRVMKLCQPRRC